MFLLRRPNRAQITEFLECQSGASFSYPDVGATRTSPPAGYTVDRYCHRLGEGAATFERAVAAVRAWTMFKTGWTHLCWPDAPIEPGSVVCSLMSHLGFWSLNACRIVYVIEGNPDDDMQRFGFAYGTLPDHAERGEELFSVEYRRADDSVWYVVVAFSQPAHPLARLGFPIARALQRRFRRDSIAAMERAVASDE